MYAKLYCDINYVNVSVRYVEALYYISDVCVLLVISGRSCVLYTYIYLCTLSGR